MAQIIQYKFLNSKNIFLMDAMGAVLSLILTGGILPLFSESLGIPKDTLYCLAIFPLVYFVFSFSCYRLPTRKPWMLLLIIFANLFYGVLSGSLMFFLKGITYWGYLFLSLELLVLAAVVFIEWSIYKKHMSGK